jgi:hypothetical protein
MSATNTATFATSPHLLIDPDDRVMTLSEWFAVNRISPATGRRLIKSGKGPTITYLSERRKGVTVGNNRKWREARSGSAA